ncbi:hypothetical protein, partial [Mycobacterium sp. E2497]|uniref:hypothetical protein n=1 Tax=Mycobacterium sp. E2497 TaxID=1834135 RepID=UPI000ABC301B
MSHRATTKSKTKLVGTMLFGTLAAGSLAAVGLGSAPTAYANEWDNYYACLRGTGRWSDLSDDPSDTLKQSVAMLGGA